jgi:hypothetical protein
VRLGAAAGEGPRTGAGAYMGRGEAVCLSGSPGRMMITVRGGLERLGTGGVRRFAQMP